MWTSDFTTYKTSHVQDFKLVLKLIHNKHSYNECRKPQERNNLLAFPSHFGVWG